MNSYGQATSYVLGNNKTSTLTTYYGIPTHYYTPGTPGTPAIQDLTLSMDLNSGTGGGGTLDLLTRTDATSGNSETFTYDANDRLKSAKVNSNTAMLFDFADNGNINSKTDVGDYSYSGLPNAVSSVTNTPANVSNSPQNITYVGFNKASVITENDYTLTYTYGPDYNRRSSELDSAGRPINKRIYCGNYEINDDQSSNPQQIYYIQSPNGLVAMIVTDNTGTNDYSVYTDQLGSILTVTADDGPATLVAQQNFDAWGRNRNPTDWSYTEASTPNFQSYNYRCPTGVPNWLYRGYTGHEMLPEFELINMNGRMYDPMLRRMLSPDNGVQEPYSTQAYNRYSYALNNPLKYNDPTGWDFDNASIWGGQNGPSTYNILGPDYGSLDRNFYISYPLTAPPLNNMNKDLIQRLDVALDFITDGHGFKVGSFILDKSSNGRVQVFSYTEYVYVDSLKAMDTMPEFLRKKEQFLELYNQSNRFKKTISTTDIDYYLQYDYETGSFTICKEVGGVFFYVLKRE